MSAVEPVQQSLPEIGPEIGHGIRNDVLQGLTCQPKSLPPRLFYDAEGSRLFEAITQLPEYYLTRIERGILEADAREIAACAGSNLTLFELGAGTAAKTGILIRALLRRQLRLEFHPVDICATALEIARERLKSEFPQIKISPVVVDYTRDLGPLKTISGRKLVLYLGSSIGNFEPAQAVALLSQLRSHLCPGDALLLGTDMVKSAAILLPAYNDAKRMTASFNQNVLARINRELGGHFNLHLFQHVALWNRGHNRMEMYLASTREQVVRIDALGLEVSFRSGERIHTENSYKYSWPAVSSMLAQAGFALERSWSDKRRWFALHLARVG